MAQSAVLVVEDDRALREALCDTLGIAGYGVVAAADGDAALQVLASRPDIGMVVSDVQMRPMDGRALLRRIKGQWPQLPVLLMTAYGTIADAVAAMRDGADDYLVKPFEAQVLLDLLARHRGTAAAAGAADPVAVDRSSRELIELARRVADSDVTVMISGESGTGKEVMARYIHEQSRRRDKPFVAINCAAIPESMLEATLFGYEKGAFTGAYQSTPGKFEQAQGGTLLLDEISEMNLQLQSKLLRVLQEREVERLGARRVIPLDVRVLATSNRVLREEVAAGRFREDLFYRLNVFPVHIAPLRARTMDIVPLAERLVAVHAVLHGRRVPLLSEAARARLTAHDWPGNVRELDNAVQRALILQAGQVLEAGDFHLEPATRAPLAAPAGSDAQEGLGSDLKAHEQQLILDALRVGRGSRKAAAERLGISPRTLRYKLARLRDAGVVVP